MFQLDSVDAYWEVAVPASEFVGGDADFGGGGVVEDDAAVVEVEFENDDDHLCSTAVEGDEVDGGQVAGHDQQYTETEMAEEFEDVEEEDDGDESPDLAVGDI